MIPIVVMILKWEKELELRQQAGELHRKDTKIFEADLQPREKTQKETADQICQQQPCSCSH